MPAPSHVAASPQKVCPLLNGMRIPQVSLQTSEDGTLDLSESVRDKPAVLVFYRGGW